jgi:hypothetical protein
VVGSDQINYIPETVRKMSGKKNWNAIEHHSRRKMAGAAGLEPASNPIKTGLLRGYPHK